MVFIGIALKTETLIKHNKSFQRSQRFVTGLTNLALGVTVALGSCK